MKKKMKIHLIKNLRISKSYNKVKISRIKNKSNDYKIKLEEKTLLPNNHYIEILSNTDKTTNYYLKLNSKEISLPLYIRNRKTGDKMIVKNMKSPKKIKDIFMDSKLPKEERETQPLLVDSNDNILWIPGIKKSKFDKANKENYDIILWYN